MSYVSTLLGESILRWAWLHIAGGDDFPRFHVSAGENQSLNGSSGYTGYVILYIYIEL